MSAYAGSRHREELREAARGLEEAHPKLFGWSGSAKTRLTADGTEGCRHLRVKHSIRLPYLGCDPTARRSLT